MVRKLGPRFHRTGSLYPVKDISVKEKQELSSSFYTETISSTGSNSSTVPNSPSDSATIVGSPISTRASSPFEIEFNDIKSQDYFSEFTTLCSKSSPSSTSSESPDSSISTPDYSSTSSNFSTPCDNKYNLSSTTGLQKTCHNNRVTKRKSSAKKGIHKLQYEQIITFNGNIKPNDMIPEEQLTNSEMAPNVKQEYNTFVEENTPIYMQEQNLVQTTGNPNLWGIQAPYFAYDNSYYLPNGPLKDGGSGDVFLTDWNLNDKDILLDP